MHSRALLEGTESIKKNYSILFWEQNKLKNVAHFLVLSELSLLIVEVAVPRKLTANQIDLFTYFFLTFTPFIAYLLKRFSASSQSVDL